MITNYPVKYSICTVAKRLENDGVSDDGNETKCIGLASAFPNLEGKVLALVLLGKRTFSHAVLARKVGLVYETLKCNKR